MSGKAGKAATLVVDVTPGATKRRGVFSVVGGADAGRVLSVLEGATVTLGRDADCTYPFDDASLSRVHARVMRVATEYVIRDDGSTNGTFVNDQRLERAYSLKDGDRVQLGSDTVMRFALVDEEEEKALRNVYDASILDALTGVHNRKYLEDRITTEIAFAVRNATELSAFIIDVDHFKKVNDTYGHLAGDAVLKAVAAILMRSVRPEDVLARYGGEEFVVLARGIPVESAMILAERMRGMLEAQPIPFEEHIIPITASAGVASLRDCGTPDRASLLGTADGRLYRAKEEGRNRVVGA